SGVTFEPVHSPKIKSRRAPEDMSFRSLRHTLALLAIVLSAACVALAVQGAEAQSVRAADVRHVSITLFKSRTLQIDKPFATALIGSPEIADILPMSDRAIYIQAKKVGTTNISIFDSNMQVLGVIDVEVTPDTG